MRLYHTGPVEIRKPDLRCGRENADFGRGFYLTPSRQFAEQWARENACMNTYELSLEGLRVRRFALDAAWYSCVSDNRAGKRDLLDEDVIIGPIVNDAACEIPGIFTGGGLPEENALALLRIGPVYEQVVLKTEKAAGQLVWLSSRWLSAEEAAQYGRAAALETAEYRRKLREVLERL